MSSAECRLTQAEAAQLLRDPLRVFKRSRTIYSYNEPDGIRAGSRIGCSATKKRVLARVSHGAAVGRKSTGSHDGVGLTSGQPNPVTQTTKGQKGVPGTSPAQTWQEGTPPSHRPGTVSVTVRAPCPTVTTFALYPPSVHAHTVHAAGTLPQTCEAWPHASAARL